MLTPPDLPTTGATELPLEQHLRALVAPLDVAIEPRTDAGEAVIVAFVVPPQDADLAAVRGAIAAASAERDRRVLPVLVSHIPRDATGAVELAALAALPVLDTRRVRRQQDDLRMALERPALELHIERVPGAGAAAGPTSAATGPRSDTPAHLVGRPLAAPAGMPISLPAALDAAAHDHPTHGVIAYDRNGVAATISYPALRLAAQRIAQGLLDAGARPADVVLVVTPELSDYFPALWGCLLAGLTPMTLAAPQAYERRSALLDKLHAAWSGCGRPWIVAGGEAVAGLRALGDVYGDERPRVLDVRADAAEQPLERAPDGGEVALLQLSSGTTGRAKPIQLTHRGLLASALDYRCASDLDAGDRAVNWLPLDHSASLLLTHVHDVVAGATNVHAPTSWVIEDPLRWLDLLERHDGQHTWAPNFAYRLVADALAQASSRHWDLTGLKSLLNGGEQITLPVLEHFLRVTARLGVRPQHLLLAWGMAETTTAISYRRFDGAGAIHRAPSTASVLLGVGPPCPDSELCVVGRDGAALHEREVGRLLVRSPTRITPGYVVDGAVQPVVDEDGWLDTGDLAFVDGGEIVISGRAKDVIIVNGVNIPAHEVEHAAGEVAGVRAGLVAACGVPDAKRGTEALAVAYVAAPGSAASATDVEVGIAVAHAVGVAPAIVRALAEDDFPRTSAGKLQRARLRALLLADERGVAGRPLAAAPHGLERLVVVLPEPSSSDPALPPIADAWGRPLTPRIAAAPPSAHVAAPVAAQQLDAADDAGSAQPALASKVAAAFAAVAGGHVDPDRPFNELGLGSIELAKVHRRLEQCLETAIPQLSLFEFPTVTRLTEHLAASSASPRARAQPASLRREHPAHAVAIVGIACRFPGASTPSSYWDLLRAGRTAVRRFAVEELRAAGVAEELLADPDFVPIAGALDDVDQFAPEAFGMTVREAALTAPQQRLLLVVASELLAVTGYETYAGEHGIGVFVGSGMHLSFLNTYLLTQLHAIIDRSDPVAAFQILVGNEPDFAATRISYRLGLTGPAVSVQTACSTSLTAVHMACRSLLAGDCDVAIAGAGAVHVPHPNGYVYRRGSILSPSGSCRAFDASADGTVGGNGVAAILLKPLAAAQADGDRVHAVIRGSAINNDGATKVGYTAPSMQGQHAVISRALTSAGVRADTISYVQAHATGTPRGDPIEVQALTRAFGQGTSRRGACHLGSVKPNVGHLDTCAGFAGLIAAVLALQHGEAPPQINYDTPNPELRLADSPFRIAREPEPLARADTPLRASVSALGVGGTNVHVVLEASE